MTIQDVVAERKINVLFHFTRLQNLTSILTHGLLPKDQCAAAGINPAINDEHRLDYTDGVCLSIGFPNYKMFYPLRQNNPGVEWAVIALKPSILWEKNVAFCRENAAKSEVTAIPLDQRRGAAALQAMFTDYNGVARGTLGIPTSYPTHPQAEVLVFDSIGPEYILGVIFDKASNMKPYLEMTFQRQYTLYNKPEYFSARTDFIHWK